MSITRPSQCLLCTFRQSSRLPVTRTRTLHSTPSRRKNEVDDDEPVKDIEIDERGRAAQKIPKKTWATRYNPRQVEAIEAAGKLIGDKFDKGKSIPRTDPWSLNYYDNFEQIDPVADIPARKPWSSLDEDVQFRDPQDAVAELLDFERSLPEEPKEGEDPISLQMLKKIESMRITDGPLENPLDAPSALMPTPMGPQKIYAKKTAVQRRPDQGREVKATEFTPELVRLMQMTGMDARQLGRLKVKTIFIDRVSNQTRLGKIHKTKFVSIAGNGQGLLGIGEGSGIDATSSRLQSQYRAIRSMQPIRRYEQRTIFGTVNGKVGATELELYSRPPGELSRIALLYTANFSRLWPSLSAPDMGDGAVRWYLRSLCSRYSSSQSDEHNKGYLRGIVGSERPRRNRPRTGEEARRCEKSVLCRASSDIVLGPQR